MLVKQIKCIILGIVILTAIYPKVIGEVVNPDCDAEHDIGKLVLKSNRAVFFGGVNFFNRTQCISNKETFYYGAEYPKDSKIAALNHGRVLIGGILNGDTIVNGTYTPLFLKEYRSILSPEADSNNDAVSEQDYISIDVDNIADPYFNPAPIHPLNIKVTKKSYAWSYKYAEDIVFFDVSIQNIGDTKIHKVYAGILLFFIVGHYNQIDNITNDDIAGLYKSKIQYSCTEFEDSLIFLWGADADGDPSNGEYVDRINFGEGVTKKSATSVSGAMFLSKMSDDIKRSFNWYASDEFNTFEFGPQARESFREFANGSIGMPSTDEGWYHLLSNGEIDYDQAYITRITQYDPVWLYPNQEVSEEIAIGGYNKNNILSIGPIDLPPGATVSFPFAYIAGEKFHRNPDNINFLPDIPESYYKNLDFSDINTNAKWARWIYDNPGIDTDGDGDSGRAVECNGERIWVEGDGVPDWKAAGPPPAPYFWITQEENALHVRFNGSRSETEKDIFTKIADFEGYNIYFGRDDREASLSLVASYDLINYDKYVWHPNLGDNGKYIVDDIPFSLDSLKCLYTNSCDDSLFDPTRFTAVAPLVTSDSIFYFTKHHNNALFSAISKVYPNARDPRLIPEDSLTDDDFTEEGFYKYFEYEFTIDNLLPTVEYWVNITAFDFGSPKSGLQALETSKTVGLQMAYPLSHEEVVDGKNEIFVYPNPYQIDANYRGNSFEGIGEEDRHVDRVRKINFANLPPKCEIKIFSLDGDLIRHLHHEVPASDPTYTHHTWDLITRNTQLIVSGMYYWTVEFPNGETKIGKFVVVM
ncbi:MAG: hypothetical protein DWP97_10260 [Calditrichaeota bacterium]|nr:MAG: hypothetical protein DWP97_10260 [Calditrichota bacterium]